MELVGGSRHPVYLFIRCGCLHLLHQSFFIKYLHFCSIQYIRSLSLYTYILHGMGWSTYFFFVSPSLSLAFPPCPGPSFMSLRSLMHIDVSIYTLSSIYLRVPHTLSIFVTPNMLRFCSPPNRRRCYLLASSSIHTFIVAHSIIINIIIIITITSCSGHGMSRR